MDEAASSSGGRSTGGQTLSRTRFHCRRRAGGAAGLEAADAGERLHQHVLELRELDDAAGVVAHGRQVAHLGEGEQPLVPRVLAGHAAEEVDLLGRRQALELEVREPPELEPQGHHGVDAAVDPVLAEGVAARPADRGGR